MCRFRDPKTTAEDIQKIWNTRKALVFLLLALASNFWLGPSRAQSLSSHLSSSAPFPLLMAHYMPWFEAKPANTHWGWHWTMNHYHPDDATSGRRQIASHAYPLIGPYDSGDPDVLECHVLLMKFAGVNGVFIDWYGTDDFLDYNIVHRNTLRLLPLLKKARLKFAVVYEDAAIPKMIAADKIPQKQAIAHAQDLMRWMQANWFTDSAYLHQDGRPVFLDFGAGYYQSDQWDRIFSVLPRPPAFFTESDRHAPAVGAFDWPQPGQGTQDSLQKSESFNALGKRRPTFIPAAFPRFHDIYAEAEVQKSWGSIEDRAGQTYKQTLKNAVLSDASIVQLVTWNDWGEGTQIEPSIEFGYRDLEVTQQMRRRYDTRSFSYTAQDLRLPVKLYILRKKFASDPSIHVQLDQISTLLFADHLQEARKRLTAMEKQPH